LDAILFRTHLDSPLIRREVARLVTELGGRYDIFVVGYCREPDALAGIAGAPVLAYTQAQIDALPYPGKTAQLRETHIGQQELPALKFFREQPGYDHYWIVEYDVRFSGPWAELFTPLAASAADLLATTVQTYPHNPDWYHWDNFYPPAEAIPRQQRLKAFLPFCRLSHAAMDVLHAAYSAGWAGHSEVLVPTLAWRAGLKVEDIGSWGAFTPPARRGKFYKNSPLHRLLSPGTFVFRPAFLDDSADKALYAPSGAPRGLLWHPIKESVEAGFHPDLILEQAAT
jgi:hypothetical protein